MAAFSRQKKSHIGLRSHCRNHPTLRPCKKQTNKKQRSLKTTSNRYPRCEHGDMLAPHSNNTHPPLASPPSSYLGLYGGLYGGRQACARPRPSKQNTERERDTAARQQRGEVENKDKRGRTTRESLPLLPPPNPRNKPMWCGGG